MIDQPLRNQIVKLIHVVINERRDVCEPLNSLPNHLVLLKDERIDKAYIIDYRIGTEPRTIALNI